MKDEESRASTAPLRAFIAQMNENGLNLKTWADIDDEELARERANRKANRKKKQEGSGH